MRERFVGAAILTVRQSLETDRQRLRSLFIENVLWRPLTERQKWKHSGLETFFMNEKSKSLFTAYWSAKFESSFIENFCGTGEPQYLLIGKGWRQSRNVLYEWEVDIRTDRQRLRSSFIENVLPQYLLIGKGCKHSRNVLYEWEVDIRLHGLLTGKDWGRCS